MKFTSAFLLILLGFIPAHAEVEGSLSLYGAAQRPFPDDPEVSTSSGGLQSTIKSRWNVSQNWSFNFDVFLKDDELTKSSEERFLADPLELNLKWKSSTQNLRLGYSTMNWEGTDVINPMDILHAKNARDPLNLSTRSSAGVFYSQNYQGFSLDVAYFPSQTKSLLPGENSPWYPRQFTLPTNDDASVLLVPAQLKYKVQDDLVLEHALDHNFGLRFKQQFETWDVSLAGFQGSSALPVLTPVINLTPIEVYPQKISQINSPVLIQPIYYRNRVVAGTFTKTFNSFILRIAGQHSQPLTVDARLPGWTDVGVLALEKNVTVFNQDITFLLQFVSSRNKEDANLSLLSSLIERAVMVGWHWSIAENWSWNLAAFQEQKKYSSYIHADLNWNLSDSWKTSLLVDILSGPHESTLGTYDQNDRAGLTLTYLF